MIIALFALGAGLHEVVKASLVGSILGNILLVLGVSMLVGGRKRDRQRFELRAATAQSLMLLLATVGLVMPAIFSWWPAAACPIRRPRRWHSPATCRRCRSGWPSCCWPRTRPGWCSP